MTNQKKTSKCHRVRIKQNGTFTYHKNERGDIVASFGQNENKTLPPNEEFIRQDCSAKSTMCLPLAFIEVLRRISASVNVDVSDVLFELQDVNCFNDKVKALQDDLKEKHKLNQLDPKRHGNVTTGYFTGIKYLVCFDFI